MIRGPRPKSGKPRTLPLTEAVVEALNGLLPHLTVDRKTGEFRFFGLTNHTAWYMFDQLRQDVKRETGLDLADVTLHTIRHTTLTRLAQGGMELGRLQEWAGHSDPRITAERYVHFMPNDLVGGLSILSNATPGANPVGDRTRPVIVPGMEAAANRADPGTPRLQ